MPLSLSKILTIIFSLVSLGDGGVIKFLIYWYILVANVGSLGYDAQQCVHVSNRVKINILV